MIAQWIKHRVIEPEKQDWLRGYDAAVRYRDREGGLGREVPSEYLEGAYPLGRWLSDHRRALRAGQMPSKRADDLEALGIVWDTADAVFAENLAAVRTYFAEAGTLAAPRRTRQRPGTCQAAGRPARRGRPGLELRRARVDGRLAAPLRRPQGLVEAGRDAGGDRARGHLPG